MEQPRLEPYLGEEKPLVPPKSLGEECLEFWANTLLGATVHKRFPIKKRWRVTSWSCRWINPGLPYVFLMSVTPRDMQDLRERLWNRPHWAGRALVDLANPTLEASILFLRGTHINPYKWRP